MQISNCLYLTKKRSNPHYSRVPSSTPQNSNHSSGGSSRNIRIDAPVLHKFFLFPHEHLRHSRRVAHHQQILVHVSHEQLPRIPQRLRHIRLPSQQLHVPIRLQNPHPALHVQIRPDHHVRRVPPM